MPEDIFNTDYWKQRIDTRGDDIHRSMYVGSTGQFEEINKRHKNFLEYYQIGPHESIIDIGCGYGRLLEMLPKDWIGDYLGIDLSLDMLKLAKERYPNRTFWECNLLNEDETLNILYKARKHFKFKRKEKFDAAICLWIKDMVINNKGEESWDIMLKNIMKLAENIMIVA